MSRYVHYVTFLRSESVLFVFCQLKTLPRDHLFQPVAWSTLLSLGTFQLDPNPNTADPNTAEPFLLPMRQFVLYCSTAFPTVENINFSSPTAAWAPLLQFSVYSSYPLCSLWGTLGKAKHEENSARKLSGSSNQSWGTVIKKKRPERNSGFFFFFKQSDRQTEGKGNIPLQILGYSGSVVH